jgi:DNA gyrase subunit A
LLCFSNKGKVYWIKVYQLPLASRGARGRPLVNLLPLTEGEQISAMLPVRHYVDDHYIFMATALGTVKKVSLTHFSRPRSNGIIAVELDDTDKLIGVALTDGEQEILLFSNAGKVIRFPEADVRSVGRLARGVRGIRLAEGQQVISLVVAPKEGDILTATCRGFGKRTDIAEYRLTGRGGQGVISIQVNERNGAVVGACAVQSNDEVMLITDAGTLVRTRIAEISRVGRNTQGVTLIRLGADESLAGLQPIAELLLDVTEIPDADATETPEAQVDDTNGDSSD